MSDVPKKKPPVWVWLALAGGVGFLISTAVRRDSNLDSLGKRFLHALQTDEVDRAYEMLSARRRAALSKAQFEALTDHPAFRASANVHLGNKKSFSDGLCSIGSVDVDGEAWGIQFYYVERGSKWWVQSFAIQPPARMQLGTLLPECGFWEGTTAGYSGPGVARSTATMK